MTETLWKSLWSNVSLGTLGCSRIVGEESVQFSHSIMSDSLQPHGLQHAKLPCPSLTPRGYSNSCPSSQWCHPTISSSVSSFPSCPQSFPASGSFPMSQFFVWPKYRSFSFSNSPSNECSGLISFRIDWLNLLAVQGTLKSLLQHHSSKASILWDLKDNEKYLDAHWCLEPQFQFWIFSCMI